MPRGKLLANGTPSIPALTFVVLGVSNVLVFALLAYLPVRMATGRRAR